MDTVLRHQYLQRQLLNPIKKKREREYFNFIKYRYYDKDNHFSITIFLVIQISNVNEFTNKMSNNKLFNNGTQGHNSQNGKKNQSILDLLLWFLYTFPMICLRGDLTVEEQTRIYSNFPTCGIFKNPREIIVNNFR